ncbi:MAG: hypothetical protein Q9214_002157 [Letrouitia sp. 1 TL-2023]
MAERFFPQPPLDRHPVRTRQASTSSSEQSSASENNPTSSHPRRRRTSPISRTSQASSGNTSEHSRRKGAKQASSGPREKPSRGSLFNMPAPIDPATEVTYTPTTHRISKAKKGKKVHACEYPGCNKVFTRAEHRKRHEANHNVEPAFECIWSDSNDHTHSDSTVDANLNRHDMPEPTRGQRSHRSTSEVSSNPSSSGVLPTNISHPPSVPAQAMSQGTMSITSIIEHPPRNDFSPSAHNMNDLSHMTIGPHPHSYHPDYMYARLGSADSPMYSSDSCYSPMSDYPGSQIANQSFPQEGIIPRPASTFSDTSFQPHPTASPLSAGSYPAPWASLDATSTYESAYLTTVGIQHLEHPFQHSNADLKKESNLRVPVSDLHRQHRHALRDQCTTAAGVAMGQGGLLKIHDPKTKHYIDCYWEGFYPVWPIIHIPSFMSSIPDSLMAASMVMIGAQLSPRPDAKHDSAVLYAKCLDFASFDSITSCSPLCIIQTVLHMEFFSRYRARSAKLQNIQVSSNFRNLYSSLLDDQELLHNDPAALRGTLLNNAHPQHIQNVYRTWVEVETRRRVLVAAFVLDIQHSTLFERQQCFPSNPDFEPLNLPFPASQEKWDTNDLNIWQTLLASYSPPSLRSLEDPLPPLDIFQCSLLTSYQIHRQAFNPLSFTPPKSNPLPAQLTHEALSLSVLTPLHALIITASESWLFGTKITEQPLWENAKASLRQWTKTEAAMRAAWHATRFLRLASSAGEEQRTGQIEELWEKKIRYFQKQRQSRRVRLRRWLSRMRRDRRGTTWRKRM